MSWDRAAQQYIDLTKISQRIRQTFCNRPVGALQNRSPLRVIRGRGSASRQVAYFRFSSKATVSNQAANLSLSATNRTHAPQQSRYIMELNHQSERAWSLIMRTSIPITTTDMFVRRRVSASPSPSELSSMLAS